MVCACWSLARSTSKCSLCATVKTTFGAAVCDANCLSMYSVGLAPGYAPVLSPEAAAALRALPPSSLQYASWAHYAMMCAGGPLMHPLVTPMLAGQPPPIQPPKLKMEESPPEDIAAAAILHGISPRPHAPANDVTSSGTGAAAANAASQAKSLTSPRSIFPNMQLVAQAGVVHPHFNIQRQGSAEQSANVTANETGAAAEAAAAPAASRPSRPSSSDEDEGIVLSVERAREIVERPAKPSGDAEWRVEWSADHGAWSWIHNETGGQILTSPLLMDHNAREIAARTAPIATFSMLSRPLTLDIRPSSQVWTEEEETQLRQLVRLFTSSVAVGGGGQDRAR